MPKKRFAFLQKIMALLCACALWMTCLVTATAEMASAPLSTRSAAQNGMVRVYLSSLGSPTQLTLTTAGSYSINGNINQALSSGETVKVSINTQTGNLTLSRGGTLLSMGQSFALRRHSTSGSNGITIAQARRPANPYPGDISFTSVRQSNGSYRLYTIAHVYIESYLYGVLPYEMGNSANIEALKSQAVAARTYTLRMMNSRSSGRYDVVDTTSDQVYNGTPSGNDNCVRAVDATKGIVLMNGSSLTSTYYSASNGGQTETAGHVWGGAGYDYLTIKDDTFDYNNPDSRVVSKTVYTDAASASQNASLMSLLKSKALTALSRSGYAATSGNTTLRSILAVVPHTPKYPSPSKLYTKMDFKLMARTVSASGEAATATVTVTCDIFSELEGLLGMSIQSSKNELWSVKKNGNDFVLQARRYGHGVGLSQRGAMYMGKLGYTYDQILAFYFTGCKRVRYSFTHTILSAVSSGTATTETTVEEAAELDESDDATATAVVRLVSSGDVLAIRAEKALSAAMIGAAPNSAPVKVLSSDGTWAFIQYGALKGYVPLNALVVSGTPMTDAAETPTVISGYATVKANGYLNLRQSGSYSAAVVTQAPNGAVLTVLGQSDGWANVQYGSIVAYAAADFLVFSDQYPKPVADSGFVSATVQSADGQGVYLRDTPSTGSAVLATLPVGTVVTVTSSDGSWCMVSFGEQTGYMMNEYLLLGGNTTAPPPVVSPVPETNGSAEMATVATQSGSLNLRSEARAGSTILTRIPKGASVIVTGLGGEWSAVTYQGVSGYVMTTFLAFDGGSDATDAPETPAPDEPEQSAGTAVVVTASGSLNLRAEPKVGSAILRTIPQQATVTVLERGADWSHVSYEGTAGYAMSVFLAFQSVAPAPAPAPEISAPPAPTASPDASATPDGPDGMPSESPSESETPAPAETPTPTPDSSLLRARVTTSSGSLNLRIEARSGSAVLTRIPKGTVLTVEEKLAAWSRVSFAGVTGYVMNSFLTFVENVGTTSAPGEQTAWVNTASGSLNLRQEPASGAYILKRIPQGAAVSVLQKGESWCSVSYAGMAGYVMSNFLRFDDTVAPSPTPSASASPDASEIPPATPAPEAGLRTAWAVTPSGMLNLRQTPSLSATVLAEIPQHAAVTVTGEGGEWCAVTYGAYSGYVQSQYLSAEKPSQQSLPGTPISQSAWVLTPSGSLNLRQSDSSSALVLLEIPRLAQLALLSQGPAWCCVTYQGVTGYVMTKFLTFSRPENAAQAALQTETPPAATAGPTTAPTAPPSPSPAPAIDPTMQTLQEPLFAQVNTPGGLMIVYVECAATAALVTDVPHGERVTVLQKGENWCKIEYNDLVGYCLAPLLTMEE